MKERTKGPSKVQVQVVLKKPGAKKVQLKPKKTGKLRKTQHRLASKNPSTRQLVGRLKRYWNRWDEIKRGELLFVLTNDKNYHCSIRGLAKDLDEKESTLRRYIMLSQLPPEERAKFREGETAKRVLARKVARDRDQLIASRIAEEKKSGALSDEVTEIVLDFCFTKRRGSEGPISNADIPTLLNRVREITRGLSVTRPVRIRLPEKISLAGFYRLARPEEYPEEFWLEHLAGWLTNILMTVAPELGIREDAMDKTEERVFANLSKAIEIRPDLDAVWQNRLKSLIAIRTLKQQ